MLKKKFSSKVDLLLYSPLFLAFLLTFTCVGVTSLDSGLYLKHAYEFTQGQFDWGMRPGFIFLLGILSILLGPTIFAAMVVVRIFFMANAVLVFFMARYLGGRKAAFAACLTFTTSYYLSFLSQRVLLDNVQPFFILLSVFISVKSIECRSDKLAFFAGFCFVYAYLVKPTTLIFLPLPFLYVLFYEGIHLNFLMVRQALIISIIFIIGIVCYHLSFLAMGNVPFVNSTLGGISGIAFDLFSSHNMSDIGQNIVKGFVGFWKRFLFQNPWLGNVFIASWCWVIIKSLKDRRLRIFGVIFILFLPAMLFLGLTNERLGQAGMFLFLTYVALGILIKDLGNLLSFKFLLSENQKLSVPTNVIKSILVVGISIALSVYQYNNHYAETKASHWLNQTCLMRFFKGEPIKWEIEGSMDQQSKKAAEIIRQHADVNAKVITGFSNVYAIDYFTSYRFNVSRFETGYIAANSLQENFRTKLPQGTIEGRLLFLWPNAWVQHIDHWNAGGELQFRYIDESIMMRQFNSEFPIYVPLDKRYRHLGFYLEKLPGAVKISSDPLIFRIDNFQLIDDFRPHIACQISMLLDELREKKKLNFNVLRNEFFPNYFKIAPEQLDAIIKFDRQSADVVFVKKSGRRFTSRNLK